MQGEGGKDQSETEHTHLEVYADTQHVAQQQDVRRRDAEAEATSPLGVTLAGNDVQVDNLQREQRGRRNNAGCTISIACKSVL